MVRPLAEPFFRPKAGEGGLLRTGAEAVLQLLMDADVEGMIGYEHSGERTIWRNGHRNRVLDTRLGSLQLRIPKLRQGSYFPPFDLLRIFVCGAHPDRPATRQILSHSGLPHPL